MTPYTTFLCFGITLYFVVPLLIAGMLPGTRRTAGWIVAASLLMLTLQYWSTREHVATHRHVRELWVVLGYAALQWCGARAYLALRRDGRRAWPYFLALAIGLVPLLYAKVAALHPSVQHGAPLAPIFGFLGISYVTFRALDVVICIRDGLITSLPPLRYFAFLLFFPAISSGPIDRYLRFSKDWERRRTRAELLEDLDGAVGWLFQGFFYKFLLAALVARHWMNPAAAHHSLMATWSYMYAYTFYLFFDFAGYSAFAVALSLVLGVRTPKNFHRPFLARNIREFWERWHISLSSWFRDHIYTRFVMASMRGKWFTSRYTASYLGFALTMGLMGLWHGLALRYLVYGLYHAALLIGNDMFGRWNKTRGWLRSTAGEAAAIAITFHAVCFGLLIFSGRLF